MITNTRGNVVEAFLRGDVDVLLHQANCQCTMGSGIAKEIKRKIPEAFEEDVKSGNWPCLPSDKLGRYTTYDHKVYNLYGQLGFNKRNKGEPDTEYWALFRAMTSIKPHLKDKKVGIPYGIGCGLGGGNWELVKHFIEVELEDIDVYLYKL